MLDRDQLLGLAPGDAVETRPLLPGLTPEPVTLVVRETSPTVVRFDVTLFGVVLAYVEAQLEGAEPVWRGTAA